MNDDDNKGLIGKLLLERGFKDWFRYMFRVIEGRPFVVEDIHNALFEHIAAIENGKMPRSNINIPPRAGKTTLMQYLTAYTLTKNPKSNIIYTSYSQSLLTEISNKVANILESPIYKAMYPRTHDQYDEELDPIDNFWRDYLYKQDLKGNLYSGRKIVTHLGGVCLFASIGSQITGYGAGVRKSRRYGECQKLSGFLIIDDAQKPADSRYQTLRERVVAYYEETLLSRLNASNVPIINVQQRLHIDDLSGVLQRKYNFYTLCRPLIDDDGKCTIPSQYTPERIEELKMNNYMFSAQYQQQPIIQGGAVIKREWFKYYDPTLAHKYKRIIITADTAMKVKEHSDYSVFIVGGITATGQLHILDLIRGKWEAPDLKKIAIQTFEKYRYDMETGVACSGLYVEDKASGIGLIQELKREGIPIVGLVADKDKLTRVENGLVYLESGQVLLPHNEMYGFNPELLAECEAFTRDDSHSHDDQVDALFYNIQEALAKNKVSLLDYFME